MPNIFQKIKNNFTNSSKSNSYNNPSSHNTNETKKSNSNLSIKSTSDIDKNKQATNTPKLNDSSKLNSKNTASSKFLFSLFIENDLPTTPEKTINNNPKSSKSSKLNDEPFEPVTIFDPDEATDEAETFNHITFIDDRSFIVDDDDLDMDMNDREVAQIQRFNEFMKENNCYTINEIPETSSNKSRLSSSRASSRNSIGSESNKTNSSEPKSGSGLNETKLRANDLTKQTGNDESEESGSGSTENAIQNGSKNALLDALMQKFNVTTSDFDNSEESSSINVNKRKENDASSNSSFSKQTSRYGGEDQNRKKSELERKINKINSEKNLLNSNRISNDSNNYVEASSSFDDGPKSIKVVRSTGTQMTASIRSNVSVNKKKLKSVVVNTLPQVFECKYIGKTRCKGLWGLKNIRDPVDRLIRNAKRNRSLNELADVEALISEKGINIVQKLPNLKENEVALSKNYRILKSGLLPINNISYAVQDNIFGKVFSCIIVREKENKVISECYSFLCSKNEIARKMALSITLAFKEYAKLIQVKESKIQDKIKLLSNSTPQESDSYA